MSVENQLRDCKADLKNARSVDDYQRVVRQLRNINAAVNRTADKSDHKGLKDADTLLAEADRVLREDVVEQEGLVQKVTRKVRGGGDVEPEGWEENSLDELLHEAIAVIGEKNA